MCSSLDEFAPGSRDLSAAMKRITIISAEQIKKITLRIILNEQKCHFE